MRTLSAVLLLLCLTLVPSSASAADPNQNGWHVYGSVMEAGCVGSVCHWVVRNPVTEQYLRVSCYASDIGGCANVGAGHWVILDGYVFNDGLTSDSRNFLLATSILAWNSTSGLWQRFDTPPAP